MTCKKDDESKINPPESREATDKTLHKTRRRKKRSDKEIHLLPERDIKRNKILNDAVDFISDKDTDKIVVADFLARCALELRKKDAQLKTTLAVNLDNIDKCFISHPGTDEVTIWEGNDIVGHMVRKEAIAQGIYACSRRAK